MASSLSEINLGVERPNTFLGGRVIIFGPKFVETWSGLDSCGSRELNQRPGRPGASQGGPNGVHLDAKIV